MKYIIITFAIMASIYVATSQAITLYGCSGGGAIVTNPKDC